MVKKKNSSALQGYPREVDQILAAHSLFPRLSPKMSEAILGKAIDSAFARCVSNKQGKLKPVADSPEKLVTECLRHLKERSDPILSPSFVSQLEVGDLFELDAVSHEMQRHRMTIGVFYQFLILELMRQNGWQVFDGSREGDIVADVDTPGFSKGLRLYMSVKKSKDTVGGQDVSGVIRRLESLAKEEKNLTRPYLCVLCVATPAKGKIQTFEADRLVKRNREGHYLSLNCEYWGPGFIFPYVTGRAAVEIYTMAIKRVANYLPFRSLKFREECGQLLKRKLVALGLIKTDNRIDPVKFLHFVLGDKS